MSKFILPIALLFLVRHFHLLFVLQVQVIVDTVTSKVRGIYATNNSNEYNYVILDKYNCSVEGGGESAYFDYQISNNHYL